MAVGELTRLPALSAFSRSTACSRTSDSADDGPYIRQREASKLPESLQVSPVVLSVWAYAMVPATVVALTAMSDTVRALEPTPAKCFPSHWVM